MIKLESLRVFVCVAEAGNIKDAANRLCRTASAISMSLKQLELEVGGALFETDRKDSLTALGAFIFETGQVQIQSFDQTIGKIQAFAANRIGRLVLASVPSVASKLVPNLLPEFIADRPGVEFELFDLDSRNVRLFVESGKADIGISGMPTSNSLLAFEAVFRDRFKLICAQSSSLVQLDSAVRWSDLEGHTLITNGASERISDPQFRKIADKASFNVPNVTSLVALVRAGLGVTLLPALVTTELPDGVVALELEDENIERVVGLLVRRNAIYSPVTAAFHEYLLEKMPVLVKKLGAGLAQTV